MTEFHGRRYLELVEVCGLLGEDRDNVLLRLANEAMIWYRGNVFPYNWEAGHSDCSVKFVEGYFWIHDPEVYASLRFLTGNSPDLENLTVSRMTPHYVAINGKMIHGTHRHDPAGHDYLPVDGGYQPTGITLRQGCSIYFWKDRVERIAEERQIDESSLPRDAVLALEKQKKDSSARWLQMPQWSEAELRDFCCGMFPDLPRTNTAELNKAEEIIRRAILAKQLPCICPTDATAGDRMYGHSRFFHPADAIRWAVSTGLFPEFPFTVEGLPVVPVQKEPVTKSKEHYADNLVYLIQAADRFWATADRDNAALQPKQEGVEKWLKEQGYTPTLAKHAARIIRPSWAKDGRRPEDK